MTQKLTQNESKKHLIDRKRVRQRLRGMMGWGDQR